ncbi:MAG: hypothetical protein ABL921_16465, partial [Pirellula sp.]
MTNRAAKYELLFKSLKKHFKPIPEVGERSVLEHLIYACCLEDARADQADEAFAKLQQAYFDWNEVRVTTVIELGEALNSLPNPIAAGHRIKRCLQSLFEARYQYDIDDLKKANLGKATDELTSWKGISSFILAYVSQNALGGHSIPADTMTLDCMQVAEIITEAEADKKSLPGIERAIPKNKGYEFASLLHQFAVEYHQNAKNAAVLAVFKDLGVTPKPKPKPVPAKAAVPQAKQSKGLKPDGISPEAAPTGKTKSPAVSTAESAANAKKSDKAKPSTTTKTDSKTDAASHKPAAKVEPAAKPDTKKGAINVADSKKPTAAKHDMKKAEAKPAANKPTEKPVEKSAEKSVAKPAEKKSETKPAAKKADDSKKPDAKKTDTKKTDVKKPDVKKPDTKKAVAKVEPPSKSKVAPSKPSPSKAGSKGS